MGELDNYSSFYKFLGRDFNDPEIRNVLKSLPARRYKKGNVLVKEGEPGLELFLIQSGSAAVFVKGSEGPINLLKKDDYFGELALMSNEPRKATVVAAEAMDVFVINKNTFSRLISQFPFLAGSFMGKLYKRQKEDFLLIKEKNKQLQQAINMRKAVTRFLTIVLVALSLYSLGMGFLSEFSRFGESVAAKASYFFTRVIEISTLTLLLATGRKMGFTLKDFGFTLIGIKRSLAESLLVTAGIASLMIALKVLLINSGFDFLGETIFSGISTIDFTFYTYIVVAIMQEFIARGMFQSTMQRLMEDKTGGISAIALCSLIFAVLHLHISLEYALISMVFSFIWGLMYSRHKTIAGASLSHFIIGNMGRLLGL